jgi:hypothetical protein
MSVENIQLNLKQKINIKRIDIRGCSLLPDGRIVFSCYSSDTVRFINKEGVKLFQIGKDKTGSGTYDTVYIKDNNSVAVSSPSLSTEIPSGPCRTRLSLNSHCVIPCKSQHVTVLVLLFV